MQAVSEANRQAQATWNNRACGIRDIEGDLRLLDENGFYNEIAMRRYVQDDPWVPKVLDFPSMSGKQILEIGHGMGADLATAALNGAHVHGIDLTPNHHEICKRTMLEISRDADLRLGNAGELPFDSNSMDLVYSLGVLHHTDNTVRCITEAHRVLKPGGRFTMALYHYWSLPHLWLVARGVLTGKLLELGHRNLLSTVEAGADGTKIKPLVKLYTPRIVRTILEDFSDVKISIHGLAYKRIPLVGRFIPKALGEAMERRWGWYVVAHATK